MYTSINYTDFPESDWVLTRYLVYHTNKWSDTAQYFWPTLQP